jgi:DNA uptake protein ComE-like DNA-binding protein
MKKHILIAIALVITVVLPIAAATKSSKRSATTQKATETDSTVSEAKAIPEKTTAPVTTTATKKKPSAATSPAAANSPRRVPAKQSRARQLMADLTETQQEKLLAFLNEASIKDLDAIHGVSTVRGAAIEKARPFGGIDEVILVSGVGEGTFEEIVKHGKTLTLSRTTTAGGKTKSPTARKSS